jgi:putative ABC transport system permease protein
METLLQDLRYGARMSIKNPGFTSVAVVMLALGIGANTAIFSVVNAWLLKPLPYRDSEQLVWLTEVYSQPAIEKVSVSHFFAWSARGQTLAQIASYQPDNMTLMDAGKPERLDANQVSAQFLTLLGVQPFLGRNFLPAEDRPGGAHAAIISHSLWQRRFSADREIVGRSITLNNQGYIVVGVMPPEFRFIHPVDGWTPLALDPVQGESDRQHWIPQTIARLKPGVTREQALSELETISRNMESGKATSQPSFTGQVRLVPLREKLVGNTRRLLLTLLGAVSLMLLIACANVANLLLSRAAVRQQEFAVRAALGASPKRLMRQMLTESWLLALGGGALGLLLAFGLTRALIALAAADTFGEITRLATIELDLRVLCFTLIVSLLTGSSFGLAPAFQFSRTSLNVSLKEEGRGYSSHRLRCLLMIAEVALAIVLLVGAGLLIRSFVKLLQVDPGYRPEGLLTLRVELPQWRYEQDNRRRAFYQEILQRVAALPGVQSVAAINHLPLNDFQLGGWLRIPGHQEFLYLDRPPIPIGVVSEDYFHTMGIPLRAGRVFGVRDNADAPPVVVLSEALARQLFPNEDAVGKQIWMPGPDKNMSTVIGVVGDVRHQGLERDVTPQVYLPYLNFSLWSATIVIRTTGDPLSLVSAVRDEALAMDQGVPVYDVQTMERRLSASISSRRFNLILFGGFAFLAWTLAAVGVYSVIAYWVTQRRHEIGIRIALGATAGDVARLFIRQGMTFVAVGIAIGLAGAWALTRVMDNLLFSVSAADPLTFAVSAFLLIVAAALACYLPARRATMIDPLVILRSIS